MPKRPDNSRPPARTPEERENTLISLATDLAEKQLKDGTASAAVICHWLKVGSLREQLERQRLEEENKLLKARTKNLESQTDMQTMYQEAIQAMKKYSGGDDGE